MKTKSSHEIIENMNKIMRRRGLENKFLCVPVDNNKNAHHDFAEVDGLFIIYLVIDKLSNLKKFELDIELSKLLDRAEGYFDFP